MFAHASYKIVIESMSQRDQVNDGILRGCLYGLPSKFDGRLAA